MGTDDGVVLDGWVKMSKLQGLEYGTGLGMVDGWLAHKGYGHWLGISRFAVFIELFIFHMHRDWHCNIGFFVRGQIMEQTTM